MANTKVKKTSENVYILRQEYNKYQKRWFPVIFYWNHNEREIWVEGLFTETGTSFNYDSLSAQVHYAAISKSGVGRCDPEDVKRMVDRYKEDCKAEGQPEQYEVQKLFLYMPELPR